MNANTMPPARCRRGSSRRPRARETLPRGRHQQQAPAQCRGTADSRDEQTGIERDLRGHRRKPRRVGCGSPRRWSARQEHERGGGKSAGHPPHALHANTQKATGASAFSHAPSRQCCRCLDAERGRREADEPGTSGLCTPRRAHRRDRAATCHHAPAGRSRHRGSRPRRTASRRRGWPRGRGQSRAPTGRRKSRLDATSGRLFARHDESRTPIS